MGSYSETLAAVGGMASCGEHLGVYVGTDERATPRGWVFMPLGQVTAEQVSEAISLATKGRAAWPPKEEKR